MEQLWKQNIYIRSSTESNIVGADDALPEGLWLRYFIEGQGYAVEELQFHQYNKSDIFIENNWKESSTK